MKLHRNIALELSDYSLVLLSQHRSPKLHIQLRMKSKDISDYSIVTFLSKTSFLHFIFHPDLFH